MITPTRGLQPPSLPFTLELLREFAVGDVSLDNPDYRRALERDATALSRRIGNDGTVVLLGSVASGKYVDVLLPVFGDRLRYPVDFVGRGDMSRGGLLLRSASSGVELPYGPLTAGVRPRGPRPPRLDPLTRVRPMVESPRRGDAAVAVSLRHDPNDHRARRSDGIVEPALRAGKAGPERLAAVVDIRLRSRPRVHRRSRSES